MSRKEYKEAMAALPPLPKYALEQAVGELFGEVKDPKQWNHYYRMISNVKNGNSYHAGKEHGIIDYLIKNFSDLNSKKHV